MPENILRISERYLNKPERISTGATSVPIAKIKQETLQVFKENKYDELIDQFLARKGSILVFVKTKHGADKIVKRLKYDGHKADAIHGNLRQSKRDRVITGFRNGNSRILIATDVAARGLDIPVIQHVINYDLPQVPEDYIHRIGRTGRAGKEGSSLTFLTPNDRSMWNSIRRLIDPNFKALQNIQKRNFKKNKKGKTHFNKKRNNFNYRNKSFNKKNGRVSDLKDKKRFFKKKDGKKSSSKNTKKPFGYTNNPKYFGKKPNDSGVDFNKKRSSFKGKKKYKNRKRPKNFSFKRFRKNK